VKEILEVSCPESVVLWLLMPLSPEQLCRHFEGTY